MPVKPFRVHEELSYFDIDHFWSGCYCNNGNAGGFHFGNDTFDDRCYCSIGTFDDRCYECDPTKRGLQMTTFQPKQGSLAPILGEDQEKQVKELPSFSRCRLLC